MLYIDDTYYSQQALKQHFSDFTAITDLQVSGRHVAICVPDTFLGLAFCLYARENQLSVLPIHANTPMDQAKTYAKKAGCEILFYGDMSKPVTLVVPPHENTAPGLIQMSSGTTGASKCIKRSWQDIAIEVDSYCQHFSEAQSMKPVVACPVTHSYGLICGVLVALARGQRPRIITNINPKFLLKQLLTIQFPLLYTSPAMLSTLLQFWPKGSHLHAAMISGTLMSEPVFKRVRLQVKNLFQQYGCSEIGCISLNRAARNHSAIGTVLPHLRVQAGGNAKQPEEIVVSKVSAPSEQAVHTQDLGYFQQAQNGESMLHFVSREDDTIIVAGMNVYPQDVEDVVLAHPQVRDAVVFKVPDAQTGQRACLQYCAEDALNADELRRWCAQHLADWQVPFRVEPVSDISRLPNGKVNRKQRTQAWLSAQKNKPALTAE